MDIFFKIWWAVLIFGFGGCFGAWIGLRYLEKSTNDLIGSYKDHIKFYKKMIEIKDQLIDRQKKMIENRLNLIALYEQAFTVIHSDLVDKKCGGTKGLDDLIRFVDGILNAKEEPKKEENKNEDHTG